MSVVVILITHRDVGSAILQTVQSALGELPLPTESICIGQDSDPEQIIDSLYHKIKAKDHGNGVLLLTDMFGSTPSNVAKTLMAHNTNVRLIAGVNVPMLLRIMNYPQLPLDELAKAAVKGAQDGIIEIHSSHDDN